MNQENQNITPPPAPVPPVAAPVQPPAPRKTIDLAKEKLRNFYYSKKKLFKSLAIALGVLLVVVIAALVYSAFANRNKGGLEAYPTPEASPVSTSTEVNENEVKLNALREKIIKLDIFQKRLAPPIINFKISF